MVSCPVCEGMIDIDEEDVDEGEVLSCDECGAELRVIGTAPLEIAAADELDEDDAAAPIDGEEEEAEDEWQ